MNPISPAETQPAGARPLALSELASDRAENLPRDYPRAAQDAVSLGSRARELLAAMAAPATHALTFWDHPSRTATSGPRRVSIDPSGSYKLE